MNTKAIFESKGVIVLECRKSPEEMPPGFFPTHDHAQDVTTYEVWVNGDRKKHVLAKWAALDYAREFETKNQINQ